MSRVVALLACGLAVASLPACHNGSSFQGDPAPAENVGAANTTQRHFPAVDVIRTATGGVMIRVISGWASGSGEPLWVVDGTPVSVDPRRGLDWFGPEQIERIEFLKTPDEAAIYGPRGVNGVLVITTKRR